VQYINPFSVVAIVFLASTLQPALSQQRAVGGEPQIIVSGSAEILIPANKASFSIGITTQAITAAGASANNARLVKAVNESLRQANLKQTDIVGSRIAVSPQWDYGDGDRPPRRTGFDANYTMELETGDFEQIGTYIDAALNAGATHVSEIEFSASDTTPARRQALEQAVRNARTDAEAVARAGAGTLGELLQITTERANQPPGVEFSEIIVTAQKRGREAVSTEVVPSQIKVTAGVIARWRFIPSKE
jgi:uncharacterized protein YggE